MNDESFNVEDDGTINEFNPYSRFLKDNDNDGIDSEINSETSYLSNEILKNSDAIVNSDEEKKDFELPDFLKTPVDENELNKKTGGNLTVDIKENKTSVEEKDNALFEKSEVSDVQNQPDEHEIENTYNDDTLQEESFNTFEEKTEQKFSRQGKVSAAAADKNPKSRQKVINKKLILSIIIIIFGGTLLVSFLLPAGSKKEDNSKKKTAVQNISVDYQSKAKKQYVPEKKEEPEKHYDDVDVQEKEDVEIPPVIPPQKKAYEPVAYSTAGSKPVVTIPDTRNDSLQGKRISGIKGLSSTQQKYSTDYQETIEKNTASSKNQNNYSLPSKEEYMNNVLNAYSSAYGNASRNNSYALQNDQEGKNAFYNSGNKSNVGQGEWLNLNTIWQGTIFEAVLTSAVNTDLPGEITARVAKNIYSSQDGRYLLIPQNSLLFGTYNSSISYAQSRVQIQWNTLIRPDGLKIELGGMNGTDAQGASGIKGHINDHPLAYIKAIALMSTVSIINSEFTSALSATDNEYAQNVLANSQQVANELGDKLIDRAMNVQPTITIKAGTKINIVVNNTLSLPPCEAIPVTQPYHRIK